MSYCLNSPNPPPKHPQNRHGRGGFADGHAPTHSSQETMTSFELTRHLNYCSERLSLIGKVAALYVQDFDDEVAVAAVNELADLTTVLSSKIWQNIMLLHSLELNCNQAEIQTFLRTSTARFKPNAV